MPINMDGTLGASARMVLDLVDVFKQRLRIPVTTRDERLSTVAAERTLLEAGLSRKKRKKVIDKMAAVFILQGYLDSRSQK